MSGEQKIHQDSSGAVNGEPGAVEKAAVSKVSFLDKEEQDFPQKAAKGCDKEIEDEKGYIFGHRDIVEIMHAFFICVGYLFFHNDSVP